jgi:hypothetical protein
MTDDSSLFTRWTDSVLGDLVWDEEDRVWDGQVRFLGRVVDIELDPDRKEPTREDQLAVIEHSRGVLERLAAVEDQLRHRAAERIAGPAREQQSDVALPSVEFAESLALARVSLHGSGELHYRSDKFLPESVITVFFEEDLRFGGAEAYRR